MDVLYPNSRLALKAQSHCMLSIIEAAGKTRFEIQFNRWNIQPETE